MYLILPIVLVWSIAGIDVRSNRPIDANSVNTQELRVVRRINNLSYDQQPNLLDASGGRSRAFSVKPVFRNAASHATFERDDQTVCSSSAELAFDPDPIKSFLSAQSLSVAYQSIRSTQFLVVTQPKATTGGDHAAYYVVIVGLDRCDIGGAGQTCSIRASASFKVAPIEDGIVKSSVARDGNDSISDSLLDIASNRTVRDATFWCEVKAQIRQLKKIEY